jgi:hypothetical protein
VIVGNFIDVRNAVYLIPIVDKIPSCVAIALVGENFIPEL